MAEQQTLIHPTAVVHPKAQLGIGVKVGAYSILGEDVLIGDGSEIHEFVTVTGRTSLGKNVRVFPHAVLGSEPQHLHYKQEPTTVEIGDGTVLREYVTVHRGTSVGSGRTTLGRNSYVMAYAHIAHDCEVGNSVILCNSVQLAGHVVIEDHANIGGLTGVVQFCRVGKFCYVGGASMIRKDLPPFLMGKGNEFEVQGINSIGLSRQGVSAETIQKLKQLFKMFYLQNLTITQAIEKSTMELGHIAEVQHFIQFIKSSKLGFIR